MTGLKIICQNKKARHDFFIEDTFEAGIVLKGTEVKSLREGKANLADSHAQVEKTDPCRADATNSSHSGPRAAKSVSDRTTSRTGAGTLPMLMIPSRPFLDASPLPR